MRGGSGKEKQELRTQVSRLTLSFLYDSLKKTPKTKFLL